MLAKSALLLLGGLFLFMQPVLANPLERAMKGICNYSSSSLVNMPGSPSKLNPSSLSSYNRGIIFTLCGEDNTTRVFKIDCLSQVGYTQERDSSWYKMGPLRSHAPFKSMCQRYF